MSETPFIKFYPGDFLGGTSGLSPAERGVYITLLCLIYEADGPIARDDARLSRRCGAPKATFARILEALIEVGKITEQDGKLSNNRAEKALIDRQIRVQNSGVAAKARWSARDQKTEQKQDAQDAPAMPPQCVADAIPEPELDRERDKSLSSRKSRMRPDAVASAAQMTAGKKRGHDEREVLAQFEKFKNDAIAKGKAFVDWDRAFVTWLDSPYYRSVHQARSGVAEFGAFGWGPVDR
jgi:uncharacterized protein YdaU (DUF1376 family)